MVTRLFTISPELDHLLASASEESASRAVTRIAKETALMVGLDGSRFNEPGESASSAHWETLAEELDNQYFDEHEADSPDFLSTFRKARAASAMAFALAGSNDESIYESVAATENLAGIRAKLMAEIRPQT